MELGTYLADSKTLKLQHPEHWDDAIRDFVQLTHSGTSADLRKVGRLVNITDLPPAPLTVSVIERHLSMIRAVRLKT